MGSLEAGLKAYVGAANLGDDGGYSAKVLAHQSLLRRVASGGKVATTVAVTATPAPKARVQVEPPAAPAPTPAAATPAEAAAAADQIALLH